MRVPTSRRAGHVPPCRGRALSGPAPIRDVSIWRGAADGTSRGRPTRAPSPVVASPESAFPRRTLKARPDRAAPTQPTATRGIDSHGRATHVQSVSALLLEPTSIGRSVAARAPRSVCAPSCPWRCGSRIRPSPLIMEPSPMVIKPPDRAVGQDDPKLLVVFAPRAP